MTTSNNTSTTLPGGAAHAVQPLLFPPRTHPTPAQISHNLNACLAVQRAGVTHSKRPFAAILTGPDHTTQLLSHFSMDEVNHAESCLARLAYAHYPREYLWQCTLYSTWEPCAMCTATIYWAHIGTVVFAASNEALAQLTGVGNGENFTMRWSTREVLEGAQKDVWVVGPVEGVQELVVRESDVYWSKTRQ